MHTLEGYCLSVCLYPRLIPGILSVLYNFYFVFVDCVKKSSASYRSAYEKAKESLPSTHPIRLGLALNYSVFHYEIQSKSDEACKLAKQVSDALRRGGGQFLFVCLFVCFVLFCFLI